MTPEKFQRVKDIFLAAAAQPRDAQPDYVAKACADDAELRNEVESLLNHHHRPTQLLDEDAGPAMGAVRTHAALYTGQTGQPLDDSTDSSLDTGRFTPGQLLANRYRIIGLLGRGGMGEVYRADDLTLGQPVALKFLPAVFASNPKWLARFYNEVRTARQIAHPNVCRVFDIGEIKIDGDTPDAHEHFISMEYIDGENLASLLRRIGRLPQDKALQIARQLCAGLAAAHDKGVLHRDLKPANVMIDGRGQVRITDFGLAAPTEGFKGPQVRAGTPAYMSPEQLAGKELSIRADIYALGLVLYELFTGKAAFSAESFADYVKLHHASRPENPSTYVHDLDPIIERVILRCLEKDPADRPRSALAVAAALPGGDPLAAALAAGETPSPEMVAAAGGHATLTPWIAGACLGLVLVGLVLTILLSAYSRFLPRSPLQKPPAVLIDHARQIVADLGYADTPRADSIAQFGIDNDYYSHVQRDVPAADRWQALARSHPGPIYFWYRQSPDYLVTPNLGLGGRVYELPPPPPGMIDLHLDPLGHLIEFRAVPPLVAPTTTAPTTLPASSAPPWEALFKAAHLDQVAFTPVPPRTTPPSYATARAAWEGTLPRSNTRVRIEAAAFDGKPTYFTIIEPWEDQTPHTVLGATTPADLVGNVILRSVVMLGMLAFAIVLAWRNIASGRADRAGAMRLAGFCLVIGLLVAAARVHHVPNFLLEFGLFTRAVGDVLFWVLLVWSFYMAVEPHVRRIWPETIISWSRLLTGQVLDPQVSRDVLIGAVAGVGCAVLNHLDQILPRLLGLPAPLPILIGRIDRLTTPVAGAVLEYLQWSVYVSLFFLMVLVVFRVVFRRRIPAGLLFVALMTVVNSRWLPDAYINWALQALIATVYLTLLVRWGLVAMIACFLFVATLGGVPLTSDLSAWYAPIGLYALAALAILAISATMIAIGRPALAARPPARR